MKSTRFQEKRRRTERYPHAGITKQNSAELRLNFITYAQNIIGKRRSSQGRRKNGKIDNKKAATKKLRCERQKSRAFQRKARREFFKQYFLPLTAEPFSDIKKTKREVLNIMATSKFLLFAVYVLFCLLGRFSDNFCINFRKM